MKDLKAPGLTPRSTVSRQSGWFGEDFKRDAVRLVDEKYIFAAAAKAVGVSVQSLRAWHKKFVPPTLGPCGENASLDELREEYKRWRRQLPRTNWNAKF